MNQCPHCKKNITPGTIFCINCGRDLRVKHKVAIPNPVEPLPVKNTEKVLPEETTTVEITTKKLTTFFNIVIFLIATACIVAFVFFKIESSASSTTDKDTTYVVIIDNLYRNTKYQFRIKYPQGWKIKQGDGPHILTKAVNERGSNINIYVEDLNVNIGDIDEVFSLSEFAERSLKKFTPFEILEKKEILIDNKKAFYVKSRIKYEALDLKADMIMLNIALVHKKYLYVVTGGSFLRFFAEDEAELKKSIRTFVIEDF